MRNRVNEIHWLFSMFEVKKLRKETIIFHNIKVINPGWGYREIEFIDWIKISIASK